jgi:hypothetical protein
MQVFGAAGIRLQLKSIGYMTLLFPSVPEPDNGLHRLTANNVVLSGLTLERYGWRISSTSSSALSIAAEWPSPASSNLAATPMKSSQL